VGIASINSRLMRTDRITSARKHSYSDILAARKASDQPKTDDAISLAACEIALRLVCKALVAPNRSGTTAGGVSRYRPPFPIVALAESERTANQLAASWEVQPYMIDGMGDHMEVFEEAEKLLSRWGLQVKGKRL